MFMMETNLCNKEKRFNIKKMGRKGMCLKCLAILLKKRLDSH